MARTMKAKNRRFAAFCGEVLQSRISEHLCVIAGLNPEKAGILMASKKLQTKISVLLSDAEYERLDVYCRDRGYKKSTLVARLIRQYLDMEGYGGQAPAPFGRAGRPR